MNTKTEKQVRNGLQQMGCVALLVSAGISLPTLAAPQAPSAEGAQQFLAMQIMKVATLVRYVDAAGRTNYVTGKYTGEVKTIKGGIRKPKETVEALPERVIDKQLGDLRALELNAIDAYGRPNSCTTRITRVEAPEYNEHKSDAANDTRAFSFKLTYTNESFTYEPLTKFMNPAQVIDWSDVKVNRSAEGYVTVTSKGQSFPTIHLTYYSADPDVADRIEYAMKFLAMSCDAGARTGF
ncbi:MAG TPA: hypothetical protein VM146_10495 [Steroidobacteraceae bacterium]|nr:hypothetical protein [Steroidobacteraceae bacterium]